MAAETVARPGLMELYGIATNKSNERALDHVGAMGMASLSMELGGQACPIAGAILKPKGDRVQRIEAELVPLLWRAKAGKHDNAERAAAVAFARWLTYKTRFSDLAPTEEYYSRLVPLAARALHEWLHDRCAKCGGSGRLEVTARGLVITRGTNARNTRFSRCAVCEGHGKALTSEPARAQAMMISMKEYDAGRYAGLFAPCRAWLTKLSKRSTITKRLRAELERD